MGVFVVRAHGINEWVISHRQRILVLALLQCVCFSNLTNTISATSYHVDVAAELHRSMARYRHLREFENTERDAIQVDEEMMKEKVVDETNLTGVDHQQQEVGLEKGMGQESKKIDELLSPTERNSNENARIGQQQVGLEKPAGHEFNKLDYLDNPTLKSSKYGQQQQRELENDIEHEMKKVERSTSKYSNGAPDLDQHRQGRSEKEEMQHSRKVGPTEEPIDEIPRDNPEFDRERQRALEQGVEHELDTKEQQQEEVREGAKEGNTEDLEPFVFPDPYLLGPTIQGWDEQRSSWLEQNPHMKSTLNKPRVLIVTGSQPESCLSPVGDNFHIKSFKLKIDYARMHGFEIYYNLVWLDPLFGGWWVKLPTLRKLMLTHPEIEWFFWVDSDAVFTDMLFEPPFHTYEGYNMVMWGSEYGLLTSKSWVAFNAGVFLMKNCQWSLDLIDKWSPMGPKGPVRDEYGKILTSFLSFRKGNFSSDDQSALAYLMITDEAVRSKVKLVESDTYTMSGFWIEVVETYEDCSEKYHPGLGDKRWPWITHFTGCGFCAGGDNPEYAYERCMESFGRAYNFADNQVLAYMGFQHKNLSSEVVFPTRHETDLPIEFVGVNPWEERIAKVAAAAEGASS